MSLKLSEFKRIQIKQTLIYNSIIFLYPVLIFSIVFILKFSDLPIKDRSLFFLSFLLTSSVVSIVVGPFVVFFRLFIEALPSAFHFLFLFILPLDLFCSFLFFIGCFINTSVGIVFPKVLLQEDPSFFQWQPYCILLGNQDDRKQVNISSHGKRAIR